MSPERATLANVYLMCFIAVVSAPVPDWPCLYRDNVKRTERVEQKDQAEDDADNFKRLSFDEHPDDIINDIEDEPGHEQGNKNCDHRN
jgi:hypothetical protein